MACVRRLLLGVRLQFVHAEWSGKTPVYPPQDMLFRALNSCPFKDVRVVILGQDPYHGPNQVCPRARNGSARFQALPPTRAEERTPSFCGKHLEWLESGRVLRGSVGWLVSVSTGLS